MSVSHWVSAEDEVKYIVVDSIISKQLGSFLLLVV